MKNRKYIKFILIKNIIELIIIYLLSFYNNKWQKNEFFAVEKV